MTPLLLPSYQVATTASGHIPQLVSSPGDVPMYSVGTKGGQTHGDVLGPLG